MQLKLGTKMYERFTNIPLPLKVKFHLFNITNKDQVLAGLERPKFQEVGPFVYQEWRKRFVVDFEDNNRKVRYRESKTFYSLYKKNTTEHYDNTRKPDDLPSAIGGNRANKPTMIDPNNTNITMLNVPLLAVLTKLAQMEEGTLKRTLAARITQRLVDDGRDKILVTRPANEFLFDGYKVDFMEAARDLFDSLGFNFESPLPGNKFGFFYMKNGTWNKNEAGEMVVYTGRHGSSMDYPNVDNWNDMKVLSVWPNNTEAKNRCNQIRGTDGSQFHPGVSRHKTLTLFSPLICTSIFIKFKEDTQVRGIPALRFISPPDNFAAPKKNPRNACYCTIKQSSIALNPDNMTPPMSAPINDSRCYLDGLLDLSLCQRGAPIAASAPHFYNADPMLAHAAGLSPDRSIHETYLDIEPMTGSVVRAASRAQINAFVEEAALNVIDSSVVGNMAPMVAPLFWLEESAEIDEEISKELKGRLLNMVVKAKRTCLFLIIIGIIIILIVGVHFWYVTFHTTKINMERVRKNRSANDEESEAKLKARGYLRRTLRGKFSKDAQCSNLERILAGSIASVQDSNDDDSDMLKKIPSTAIAGSMGAIGAELPDSDRKRLVDNEEQDSHLDDPTKSLIQGQQSKDNWDDDSNSSKNNHHKGGDRS